MSDEGTQGPFRVLLVENNPYDRAVIDACFGADPEATLQYTLPEEDGTFRAVSPTDLWGICADEHRAPDLVLLDLALTKQCGEVLATEEYRSFLRDRNSDLRRADDFLSQSDYVVRRLLVSVTLAINRLRKDEGLSEKERAREHLNRLQEGFDENEGLDSLASERSALLEAFDAAIEGRKTPEDALTSLWGTASLAETVRTLAEAPSLLRIFACVASFSNTCFGVVSHYADDDTILALKRILGFRNRCASHSQLEEIVRRLVVNKSSLFGSSEDGEVGSLTAKLRTAHRLWRKHQSPEAAVAPYGRLPVVAPEGEVFDLFKCVDKIWPFVLLSQRSRVSCVILWDETRFLVGRAGTWKATSSEELPHRGWKQILANEISGLEGIDFPSAGETRFRKNRPRPKCYVIGESVEKEASAADLGARMCAEVPKTPKSIVIVGGSPEARTKFEASISGRPELSCYRIPGLSDGTWSGSRRKRFPLPGRRPQEFGWRDKKDILSSMVKELPVTSTGDVAARSFFEVLSSTKDRAFSERVVSRIVELMMGNQEEPSRWWGVLEANAVKILKEYENGREDRVLVDNGFPEEQSAI